MDSRPGLVVGNAYQIGGCLHGANKVVSKWLLDAIGPDRGATAPCDTAIGVVQRNEVRGAIGFVNWRQPDFDIQIHAAFEPGCPSRDVVCQAMRYAFEQLGCKRITSIAVGNNEKALRFIEFYGFTREGALKKAHRGEQDLVLFRLTPRMWKRKGFDKGRQFGARPVSYLVKDEAIQVIQHG